MKALKQLKNTMSLLKSVAPQETWKSIEVSLIAVLSDCLLKEDIEKNANMAVAVLRSLDEKVLDFWGNTPYIVLIL